MQLCNLYNIVDFVFNAYLLVLLIYAVVSWIPSIRGRWSEYVAMLVEPVLAPVRQIIPPLGGLDLSFLIVMILLRVIDQSIVRPQTCGAGFIY